MLFNMVHSADEALNGDPIDAFTKHSEAALGKLLNKSGFAINPALGLPAVMMPVLNKIKSGEVPSSDEWDKVSHSFMIKIMPNGRAISQMFDEEKSINALDFGFKQSGLGRFTNDVNKPQ